VDLIRTVEDRRNFIRQEALKQLAENDGLQGGIWHKGRLAGVVECHSIDWQNRSTTLGYWLGEGFQGKGIMTEACRALVNYAFKELRLNRVGIACATENHRSRVIPERLGFR
jgi:ribosomal-protein-serine acetyltransferase